MDSKTPSKSGRCRYSSRPIVYQACHGKTSFDDLKLRGKITDDVIFLALEQLKEAGLIEERDFVAPVADMNRREVIRKVGLASMAALPVISSLIAPTAADAQSCVG